MNFIYEDDNFSKEFVDYFISVKKSPFFILFNMNNLLHLSNILNIISLNYDKTNKDVFTVILQLFFFSETYCYILEKKEKYYLCAILSQNKFYLTKTF